MNTLFERYSQQIVTIDMLYKIGVKNKYTLPEIEKIILHGSSNHMMDNKKELLGGGLGCELITQQKSIPTKAKKHIAAFSLREKLSLGIKCTLRGKKMYNFLTRCIYLYFPRMNNFYPKASSAQKGVWNCSILDIRSFIEVEYFFQYFETFPGCTLSIFFKKKKKQTTQIDMVFLSAFCIPIRWDLEV